MKETLAGIRGWPALMSAVPALALCVYGLGFLATNAHLSKYGVFNFDLISHRYLVVGVLFVVFVGFWFCIAGRTVLETEFDDGPEYEDDSFVDSIHLWIRTVFSVCVSSGLCSLFLLGRVEVLPFCVGVLVLAWIRPRWENFWESASRSERFPRLDATMNPFARLVAILFFLVTAGLFSDTAMVFVCFLLLSAYSRVLIRSIRYYREHHEELSSVMTHGCILLLLSPAIFGWVQYEQIRSGFGGGQRTAAAVGISDKEVTRVLEDLGFEVGPSFLVDIVYESETEIIVSVTGKTIRLSRSSVAGVQVLSPDTEWWISSLWDAPRSLKHVWQSVVGVLPSLEREE